MGTRTRNGYLANMAKQIEAAIINCGNPFVEVYLDSMDCSIEAELSNLRWLQKEIALPLVRRDQKVAVRLETSRSVPCLHGS